MIKCTKEIRVYEIIRALHYRAMKKRKNYISYNLCVGLFTQVKKNTSSVGMRFECLQMCANGKSS